MATEYCEATVAARVTFSRQFENCSREIIRHAVSIFSPQVLVFLSLSSNRLFSIAYFVSYLICCLAQVKQIYPINQVKLV